jgi:hypothetical protein
MTVCRKSSTRGDAIVVDYPQRTKAHAVWIVKTAEGKCMITIEPACLRATPVISIMNEIINRVWRHYVDLFFDAF